MKNFFSKYKYQLLLLLAAGVLFFVNYKPGTNLLGWDALSTGLNPWLAVKRAFFSVWEEYQSFGLTAGMAHATDLVRATFLWIISYILPSNIVRYFYHFLMLAIGGIGMLKLLSLDSRLRGNDMKGYERMSFRPSDRRERVEKSLKDSSAPLGMTGWPAFIGALFYMLNLGTVQIFYLPFEAFSTFFAFLPWGIWIFIKLIKTGVERKWFPAARSGGVLFDRAPTGIDSRRAPFLLFLLINLLGTPAFYTQQLFVVYILVLGCIALGILLSQHTKYWILNTRYFILAFLLILAVNSFWILPQIYFLKVQGSWVSQAKVNQMSTEQTFYQNLSKGTIGNFARLEGFYYDLKGLHGTYLFAPWKDHFSGVMGVLPYLMGLIGLIGLMSLIGKKRWEFVLIFLLCALALLSATPPFSWINDLVRQNSFINQIFRSPFTKFIIPYSLVYSFFVAKGANVMLNLFQHPNRIPNQVRDDTKNYAQNARVPANDKRLNLFICLFVYLLIFFYTLPSFQGYFISPEMKVAIPQDYLQVINYFQSQPDKNQRIALLPDYTYWGWFFTNWGYNGSGFLWYGIEQPIISRTFDVWSPNSESYYWEAKQALEAENLPVFEKILDKYDVNYLLVDQSLIPVVSTYKSLNTDRLESLLSQSSKIALIFKTQNLALYKVSHSGETKNFVSVASNIKTVGPDIKVSPGDTAYQNNGIYESTSINRSDYYYPFLNLTSQTDISDKAWEITEDSQYIYVSSKLEINPANYNFYMPSSYLLTYFDGNKDQTVNLIPEYKIEGNTLSVRIPKIKISEFNKQQSGKDQFGFDVPTLSQKYGYLAEVTTKNVSGSPYLFYISDDTKNQSIIEDKLSKSDNFFIIPEHYQYGLGYSFNFQNQSYANYPAKNIFQDLKIYAFPYDAIKQIHFSNNTFVGVQASFSSDFTVRKTNYFTYEVSFPKPSTANDRSLILYQSFDPGWLAYADGKILPHVKINNWANGWNLQTLKPSNLKTIYIIYWPQYLEYIGYALIIVIFAIVLARSIDPKCRPRDGSDKREQE